MPRVVVAPRCKFFGTIAFDDLQRKRPLARKLSRPSLNEAMLQRQERSKCDVSSELSQVPVFEHQKRRISRHIRQAKCTDTK